MPNNYYPSVHDMLPNDLGEKVRQFDYQGEAAMMWNFLLSYIANGSREFFSEWTDHGVQHIASVFDHARNLIAPSAADIITPNDVFCLSTAILLHDLAMSFDYATVERLIYGTDTAFPDLRARWESFCSEMQHWDEEYVAATFGPEVEAPKSTDISTYTNKNRFVIGEFLRRHHGEISRRIVEDGFRFLSADHNFLQQYETFHPRFRQMTRLSAYIAESHTLDLRQAIQSLKKAVGMGDQKPPLSSMVLNVHYAFIMTVLRLSDYLDFRNSSSQYFLMTSVKLRSPISQLEHATMDAYMSTVWEARDMEEIAIQYSTNSPAVFFHFANYLSGIQYQLDLSWAILSEHYSATRSEVLALRGLTARRVVSANLENDDLQRRYYPELMRISVSDASIIFLLAGPLYNDDPRFCLREVISNAHDAMADRDWSGGKGAKEIVVRFDDTQSRIEFIDTGIGMSLTDLSNYFLRVGGRLRSTLDWKVHNLRKYGDCDSSYAFSSRFGVGVVSLFMVGNEIDVYTRRGDNHGIKLAIRPNLRELIAERNDCEAGTRISIAAKEDIMDRLSELAGAFMKDADGSGGEESYSTLLEAGVRLFNFVTTEYNLQFAWTTELGTKRVTIPSLQSKMQSHGLSWFTIKDSGSEFKCIVLRGASASRRSRLVVYNGIPVRVEVAITEDGFDKRAEIILIEDPSNKFRFNLQKTLLDDGAIPIIRKAYAATYEGLLKLINQRGSLVEFLTTNNMPSWLKFTALPLFRFDPPQNESLPFDGRLPLVFFYKGKVNSLSAASISQVKPPSFAMMGANADCVEGLVALLPPNVPFIIYLLDKTTKQSDVTSLTLRSEASINPSSIQGRPISSLVDVFRRFTDRPKEESPIIRTLLEHISEIMASERCSGIVIVGKEELLKRLGRLHGEAAEVRWTQKV